MIRSSSSSSSPLQVDETHLDAGLTSRTFMTKQEQVTKPLSLEQAVDCRDALAKVITSTPVHSPHSPVQSWILIGQKVLLHFLLYNRGSANVSVSIATARSRQ